MINSYILTVNGQSQNIEGRQFIIENNGPSEVSVSFASSGDSYELSEKENIKLGPFEVNLVDQVTVNFGSSSGVFNEVQILQLK